jgi:hypothetical protein
MDRTFPDNGGLPTRSDRQFNEHPEYPDGPDEHPRR